MMEMPLVYTKLSMPVLRKDLVVRERLIHQLDEGLKGTLTLVSAPAGFGKSTLVAMWARETSISLGWVSLDERDNDPNQFLTYIFAAINAVGQVGDEILSEIQSPQNPPNGALLMWWINELRNHPSDLILVLDDYHAIENQAVHQNMEFLLEHMPANFHLVLICRSDPHLHLGRIRGCGKLTEIRESDLRFSYEEVSEFLESVMDLNLSVQNISALEQRTEGWIVGLQLAALAIQRQKDVDQFIQKFSGGHQHIIDYLAEEVFDHQDKEIQTFLLKTSILESMCASLCDAIIGGNTSKAMLDSLNQGNLFVIPLNDERQWYRYHHMFSDLLRYKLGYLNAGMVKRLHKRAGKWYAEHDFPDEALRHFHTAEEFNLAADLIETIAPELIGYGKLTLLKSWIELLPESVIKARHYMCLYHAWVLNLTNQVDILEARLQDTEHALTIQSLDDQTISNVRGQIAQIRAYDARRRKNLTLSLDYLNEALNLLPEKSYSARSAALFHLGLTYIHQGKLTEAARALSDARPLSKLGGNIYVTLATTGYLAEVQIAQGNLRNASKLCSHAIEDSLDSHHPGSMSALAYLYVSLGKIHYEWDELDHAANLFLDGISHGERTGNWRATMPGLFSLAWLRQVQGRNEEARFLLVKAASLADRARMSFREMELDAWQARIDLAQDNIPAAGRWAGEYQEARAKLPSAHEFSDVIFVRILNAQNQFSDALELLDQQFQKSKAMGADGQLIGYLVLKAIIYHAQNDKDQARKFLERALVKAEPEKYIRTFVDEGPPMVALLTEFLNWSSNKHDLADYVKRLLSAFPEEQIRAYKKSIMHAEILDSLNDREQQIIRLLADGLKTPEIAEELQLAKSTVKWYLKKIYSKLGVHRKADAIARAKELGVLE